MIGSGKLQPDDLKLVVSLLQAGDVEPWQCAPLSYGRGLNHLTSSEIAPLLDELARHGAAGLWTALDMIFMYLHPDKMPDAVLEKKLKAILVSPKLFDHGYRWCLSYSDLPNPCIEYLFANELYEVWIEGNRVLPSSCKTGLIG